ncbi:DUF1289 domain-containing protein [Halomonas sp. 328]|uniref:DUF1289 domain-containing protein n=1 Tax=Halomonas sp. 328 TaxID=2776704 RepID=UPI0018A7A55B|nr:DUF1289 domain-containing protein [Halomonas sp. 328]MBF8224340.1 DUF1289 domain-containing protein [Halomonas sp. 328]
MSQRISTPCVGVCSTTVGDDVCRGCQRHLDEIRDWFGYDEAERRRRIEALDALREKAAATLLVVEDEALLNAQLARHRIRVRPEQPPLSRAVELLRVGRERIQDLARYGLARHGAGLGLAPPQLFARLNEALSQAARERVDLITTDSHSG